MTDRPGLNQTQLKVLTFIDTFIKANGFGPTFDEIATGTGYKGKSVVHKVVRILIERGYLIAAMNQAGRISKGSLAIASPNAAARVTVMVSPTGKFLRTESRGSVTVIVRTDFPELGGANG